VVATTIVVMAEHRWAPPEHQDLPVFAAESLPLDEIGEPTTLDAPAPVWIDRLVFEQIGDLKKVKACTWRSLGRDGFSVRGCPARA
jgi:hypothetical protein